jgi:hypothetical protein
MLKRATCDVLILLDCCFAANAARGDVNGINELLAACGREVEAEGVTDRSFTRNLIRKLRSFGPQPFTVSQLHQRLMKDRKRLVNTPVYFPLSGPKMPSICLSPLRAEPHQNVVSSSLFPAGVIAPHLADSPGSESTSSPATSGFASNSTGMSSPFPISPDHSGPRVLMAISLDDNTSPPDVSQWAQWLSSDAPHEIRKLEIKIESAYQGHSLLVLVSMPVSIWDHLPNNSAYRFVAFITSQALQIDAKIPDSPQLQSRRPPGAIYSSHQPMTPESLLVPNSVSPSESVLFAVDSKDDTSATKLKDHFDDRSHLEIDTTISVDDIGFIASSSTDDPSGAKSNRVSDKPTSQRPRAQAKRPSASEEMGPGRQAKGGRIGS